ncbi:MAG: CBS domain-containing protein [Bdellovibrionota bacterium]
MTTTLTKEMSTNLITVNKAEILHTAYRIMSANRIRHLAVTNEFNEICGILSDRDVQRGMSSQVTNIFGMRVEDLKFLPDSKVGDYMTWPPKMISAESDLRDAAQLFLDEKISAVLIADGKKVEGIITTDDLLRVLLKLLNDKDGITHKISDFFTKDFLGRVSQMASDSGL